MTGKLVAVKSENRRLLVEIAKAVHPYEDEISQVWQELFNERMKGSRTSNNVQKNFRDSVSLFLTSLSDGEFEGFLKRIGKKGEEWARMRERYEDLIFSFHIFEEATFPFLRKTFPDRISEVVGALEHFYHDVLAVLSRAYFTTLEREMEKMVGMVAHDLRSPLQNIMGFTDLIMDFIQEGKISKEEEVYYIKKIKSNGIRMQGIIDNALSYGCLKNGRIRLMPEPFDSTALCIEAFACVSHQAMRRRIDISINGKSLEDAADLTPITMVADRLLIFRAVENYLVNALKYADSRVSLSIADNGDDILFSVEDDGPGIPAEEINLVFNDYYVAEDKRSGTGLGLPIVRMIAELHKGKAWAESEAGSGCTFLMTLPKASV